MSLLIGKLNPRDKLSAARLMAREKMPYFTAALVSLAPMESPGLGTVGVTKGGVLLYDPAALDKWTVPQLATVLLHEVGHLIRDHHARCEACGADPSRWNIASDAELNDDLKAGGFEFPTDPNPVLPSQLKMADGLTAEAYYHGPWQSPPAPGGGAGAVGQGGRGAPPSPGAGKAPSAPQAPGAGAGWCGSGGGRPLPGEPAEDAPANRTPAELASMRREVAAAVREEAQKGRGNVPAGWQRWADAALKPAKVRWQDKLARAARRAVAYRPGAEDYRYDRPSRRQASYGYGPGSPILPRTVRPVPHVAVVVDTSGSMGTDELTAALRESRGILTATGAKVEFCACDASVHALKPVERWEELPKLLLGGGGTDFRPAFKAVERARSKPEVLIFITDGDGPAPATMPHGIKVIWLLVGAHRVKPATWGEIIELDN
jgi:predicted metal-dependent peptidase